MLKKDDERHLGIIIGVIGVIIGLTPFVVPIEPFFGGQRAGYLSWVVLLLVISLILFTVFRVVDRAVRDGYERMAEVMNNAASQRERAEELHKVVQDINGIAYQMLHLHTDVKGKGDVRAVSAGMMHDYLKKFANCMQYITGVDVRACIKVVTVSSGNDGHRRRVVKTLARSNTHLPDPTERIDAINKNTDFQHICSGRTNYWHSNDINAEPDYSNTSYTLPYKSVLVWGVRVFDMEHSERSVIAFLCIDSKQENAFELRRDLVLGWPVVDAIRSFLTTGVMMEGKGRSA